MGDAPRSRRVGVPTDHDNGGGRQRPIFPNFPNHKNKGDHITTINAQLRRYGDKLGYTFVDLYPEFLNGDGQLDSKLTYDGLHLNYAGYEKWVFFLKTKKYL